MKTEREIKDLYFDVIFTGVPEDIKEGYREKYNESFSSCVEDSFGFARYRLGVRIQELGQEIKSALSSIFCFIK